MTRRDRSETVRIMPRSARSVHAVTKTFAGRLSGWLRLIVVCTVVMLPTARDARAAAYVFAGEANGINLVTHPLGYTGVGGQLNISIGIDPTSANAAMMEIPTQNVVQTWNQLQATTGNLLLGGANDLAANEVDFESVLLHEMGHALGLAHVNAASESGLTGSDTNYTKATDGANNAFDINAGVDGVRGSDDDLRGDDVNLNWFKRADNDPFTLPGSGVIDTTTYSREVANLPGGDTFSTNADRTVATLARYNAPNTEAVMQQGTFFDEEQRTLSADDVVGIRYAMAGLDEVQGTADDYTLNLTYAGLDAGADIVIDFDNSEASFAATFLSGVFVSDSLGETDSASEILYASSEDVLAGESYIATLEPNLDEVADDLNLALTLPHAAVTSASIFFNTGFNWFYNQEDLCKDGDVDCDGDIDFDDFLALQIGFGATSGAERSDGDLDGDGDVDFDDFLQLQVNFGLDADQLLGSGGSTSGAAVPEPSTVWLLAAGLLMLVPRISRSVKSYEDARRRLAIGE